MTSNPRHQCIQRAVVTAEQMRQIEGRLFAAGLPIAALMEKVAGLIVHRVVALYPWVPGFRVGIWVGPGHNGGDALIVARELLWRGYTVKVFCPFTQLKELTAAHASYAKSLGIPFVESAESLDDCGLIVDGLFGFGLERSLSGAIATAVDYLNTRSLPVISIDLPSGLHTDTGQVLGTAINATHTLCLGLWKQGLLQDHALEQVGTAELVDFDIPLADIEAVLGETPKVQRITPDWAIAHLPLHCSPTAHKYTMGHLLLICGSRRYAGAAMLSGLGARASGVGMLSIAVPQSLKPIVTAQLPEALILDCPETASGAIAALPDNLDWAKYGVIACGPGLTLDASPIMQTVLTCDRPLVLDADGLTLLATLGTVPTLRSRTAPTVLTPHLGEFRRLFPDLAETMTCRVTAVQSAAAQTGAIVLLKGARVAIADPHTTSLNPDSTPALARGGSGDVLTGLLGGLLAGLSARTLPTSTLSPSPSPFTATVQAAAWWHAHAGICAAEQRTQLGVDAQTLAHSLIPALQRWSETTRPGG